MNRQQSHATEYAQPPSPAGYGWPTRVSRLGVLLLAALAAGPARAASDLWTGAGADPSWTTAANWTNGVPVATSDVFFLTNGVAYDASTYENMIAASTTIQSLSFLHTNYYTGQQTYHNTYLNDGVTLTISNSLTTNALFVGAAVNLVNPATRASITGPNASLVVLASNGVVNVRQGGSQNYAGTAVLDMSGLSNCTVRAQRMLVAGDGTNGSLEKDRPSGVLNLAQRTTLYLGATASPPGLTLGYNIGNGGTGGVLQLGQTNYIYSDYGLAVGMTRSSGCLLSFGPYSSPFAYFRNVAGTGRQSVWLIGDSSSVGYSGNSTVGTADFSAGVVDAQVNQLVVGRSVNDTKGLTGGGTVGTLTLNAGIIDANTATIGYMMKDYCAKAQGTVNVDGTAQLIVNNSMQLGYFTAYGISNGASFALLNIGTLSGGGAVVVKGNITTTTSALNSLNDSEIIMRSGASLYVKGSIGPLYLFELSQSALSLDLGYSPNPVTAVCTTTNLTTGGPVTLNVSGSGLLPGQFALIKYQTWNGTESDIVLSAPFIQGYLSNNVANSSIDLVITNLVADTWVGNVNGDWDINLTANWKNASGASTTYKEPAVPGDIVIFDDTASGTTTVNLAGVLNPTAVNAFNSAKDYTFTGTGALGGPSSLFKAGTGKLVLANSGSNSFTGPVTINGGTLQLNGAANRLPTSATVSLLNTAGAALDLNNLDQTVASISGGGTSGGSIHLGSGNLVVTGSGNYAGIIDGSGRLIKTNSGTLTLSGANQYAGGTLVISNAVVSVANTSGSGLGTGNVDIEGSVLYIGSTTHGSGGAYGSIAATAITNNTVGTTGWLYHNRSDTVTFAPVLYGSGQMYLGDGTGRVIIDHANFHSGQTTSGYGPIRISHPNALGTGVMLVGGLNGAQLELVNNITVTNNLSLNQKGGALGQPPNIVNVSDTNTLTGTISLLSGGSDWVFRSDAGKLIIRGSMVNSLGATRNYWLRGDGDGEVYSGFPLGVYVSPYYPTNNLTKNGLGTWTLWGTNTYNGSTTVSNGVFLVNGQITPGAASANQNVQVYGGLLGGSGIISVPVILFDGARFSPGAKANTVGTLTVNHNLSFSNACTCTMDLKADASGVAFDQVKGLRTVTYGGTLQINLVGTLNGGEIFRLFSATNYAGAFATISLPTLPAALSWDTSKLAVDGTVRVLGGVQIGSVARLSDGNIQLGGTGTAGQPYRVLATTDLLSPSGWVQVGAGAFVDGIFSFTDLSATNYQRRYYRVVTP